MGQAMTPQPDARALVERLKAAEELIAHASGVIAGLPDCGDGWEYTRPLVQQMEAWLAALADAPVPPEVDVQLLAWAVSNCHMLARRRLRAGSADTEQWGHVLRICEKAGARSAGVRRASLPTELTEGTDAPVPPATTDVPYAVGLNQVEGERSWCCRFHPFNWWHEVGCPHVQWTPEQLKAAEKCAQHPTFVRIGCPLCAVPPATEEETTLPLEFQPLHVRLAALADYMEDAPAMVETDRGPWRDAIKLQREAAQVLAALSAPVPALTCSTCGATNPDMNPYCSNGFHAQRPKAAPALTEQALLLRDNVIAIVEQKANEHQLFVKTMPNRYADADTIRRSDVLTDVKQLRRELLQELDAAIVAFVHSLTPEGQ